NVARPKQTLQDAYGDRPSPRLEVGRRPTRLAPASGVASAPRVPASGIASAPRVPKSSGGQEESPTRPRPPTRTRSDPHSAAPARCAEDSRAPDKDAEPTHEALD